jgi:hypothetical protein
MDLMLEGSMSGLLCWAVWPCNLVCVLAHYRGIVGTCSPGQDDPTGEWKECKQMEP